MGAPTPTVTPDLIRGPASPRDTIAAVERWMATLDQAGKIGTDPMAWHRARNAYFEIAMKKLTADHGARFFGQGDNKRVRLAGITAGSTQGHNGALRNWLTAAHKKVEAE